MKTCIFCGPTTARMMSAEHIYSDWISRRLRKLGIKDWVERKTSMGRSFKPRKAGAIDIKVPVVCQPCNNEWLGNIERKYLAPFFFDMIRGQTTALTVERQVILAFWLTRLAMAYEFKNEEGRPDYFFSQDDRQHFYEHAKPPTRTRIWVARFAADPKRFKARVGSLHRSKSITDFSNGMYVVTGVLGCFAYQFFSRRWSNGTMSEAEVDRGLRKIVKHWTGAQIQIFPESDQAVMWPPNSLDRSAFKTFSDRFGDDTPPL
jgi:hypothetical protein